MNFSTFESGTQITTMPQNRKQALTSEDPRQGALGLNSTLFKQGVPPPHASRPKAMLEADKLECMRGDRRLFKDVSFRLEPGKLLYLQGKNGAGKTSLLRILIGLLPPESGALRWQEQVIADLSEDYRAQFCYLGHHNAIKEELTALENLLSAAELTQNPLTQIQALDALAQVGLAGREDLPCKYLSQGQKRRVALARLVNEHRPLWVLDEPFVALDTGAVAWLAELIAKHLDRGGMAVMTTHQPVPIGQHTPQELRLS